VFAGDAYLELTGDIVDRREPSCSPARQKTSTIHLLFRGEKGADRYPFVFFHFQLNPVSLLHAGRSDAPF